MTVHFTIPGVPVAKGRVRVYNGHGVTPQKTRDYEAYVQAMYRQQCGGQMLQGGVKLSVMAYMPIPKSVNALTKRLMQEGKIRPTKRPDIDNIYKSIADALNEVAYKDDSGIVQAYAAKWYDVAPRVEVAVEELC
jgi:Holliday junction resolvase RusA-like endonuclease